MVFLPGGSGGGIGFLESGITGVDPPKHYFYITITGVDLHKHYIYITKTGVDPQ